MYHLFLNGTLLILTCHVTKFVESLIRSASKLGTLQNHMQLVSFLGFPSDNKQFLASPLHTQPQHVCHQLFFVACWSHITMAYVVYICISSWNQETLGFLVGWSYLMWPWLEGIEHNSLDVAIPMISKGRYFIYELQAGLDWIRINYRCISYDIFP